MGSRWVFCAWTAFILSLHLCVADSHRRQLQDSSTASTQDYSWDQLLDASLLFYEAQRSGKLPASNRVSWRGDSALQDKGPHEEDLSGGHFDSAGFLKEVFPYGSTTATLAWGVLEFKEGFRRAGVYPAALEHLYWAASFLLACHIDEDAYVASVGMHRYDDPYWGRPEVMKMSRPVYLANAGTKPSSDLLGSASAGLSSVSLVFRRVNSTFAHECLLKAQILYVMATEREGLYSGYGKENSYASSSYLDDLAHAAVWLYKATNAYEYLRDAHLYWARSHQSQPNPSSVIVWNWDTMIWPADVLLLGLPNQVAQIKQEVEWFLHSWMNGLDSVQYTPQGLAWTWGGGQLRNVANAALIAQVYAKRLAAAGENEKAIQYQCWAVSQMRQIAGDGGRSYIIGQGYNPPTHSFHKAASCPPKPAACGWKYLNTPHPNQHVLSGALIGGPDADGSFVDTRNNSYSNQPFLDYNAGWTGALAALLTAGQPPWDTCKALAARGGLACGTGPGQLPCNAPPVQYPSQSNAGQDPGALYPEDVSKPAEPSKTQDNATRKDDPKLAPVPAPQPGKPYVDDQPVKPCEEDLPHKPCLPKTKPPPSHTEDPCHEHMPHTPCHAKTNPPPIHHHEAPCQEDMPHKPCPPKTKPPPAKPTPVDDQPVEPRDSDQPEPFDPTVLKPCPCCPCQQPCPDEGPCEQSHRPECPCEEGPRAPCPANPCEEGTGISETNCPCEEDAEGPCTGCPCGPGTDQPCSGAA